jgi:hypothetical protein
MTIQLGKGFALDIPAGYGSQKSGARSQNGPHTRVEQAADFVKRVCQCLRIPKPRSCASIK